MADLGGSWDVFLAYASRDRERAQALFEALTAADLKVCFDQDVLLPGDDWHALLPRYLRQSAVVLALVSPSTDEAHFERSELLMAINMVRREGRRLVPVRLVADVDPPYGTEMLHAIDMFGPGDVAGAAAKIAGLFPGLRSVEPVEATQVLSDRIPVPPKFFTGREDLLARVGALVRADRASVVTQAIEGLGGVGKTSLAAALVEAHRHAFDIVWWVQAETPAGLIADLAELAPHLGLPVTGDPADTAAAVRAALSRTDRSWLLVFDNAVNERALEAWLPVRGTGAVLITSRNTEFPNADEIVPVDTFPPAVAAEFLRSRVQARNPHAAVEDLGPVIERLDGLPLALEQAAAWVTRTPERRFARFVELYDDHTNDPFPDGTSPRGYEQTATTTWRVSIDAANGEAPLAESVLSVLAFCAPVGMPTQWLRDMGDDPFFEGAGATAVDDALAALHAYSVAAVDPDGTIAVHRVIQAAARRNAPPGAIAAAIRTLRAHSPGDAENHLNWPTLATLAPHALALVDRTQPSPDSVEGLWWVLDDVASYQRSSGNVNAAITTATRALDLGTTWLGPDHVATLTSRTNLAIAFRDAGDLGRAIPLLEATLADWERVLGADHPATVVSRAHLAVAYRDAGDLGRALPLLEATLADQERVQGADHPNTLRARNNVAFAYRMAGDLDRAIPMYEATLVDRERVLGADHPDTLNSRHNLAGAYRAAGDFDRAIPLFEATLVDRERVLGADHPDTLNSRHNVAFAYRAAGDFERAIPLFEASLVDRERVLGADHPDTLNSRNNLAGAYYSAGQVDRAIPLFEANLADQERVLSAGHPDILTSRRNLEAARRAQRGSAE